MDGSYPADDAVKQAPHDVLQRGGEDAARLDQGGGVEGRGPETLVETVEREHLDLPEVGSRHHGASLVRGGAPVTVTNISWE